MLVDVLVRFGDVSLNVCLQASVDEATPPDVSVLTVNATDDDAGENARITYSMLAQPAFYIEPTTGACASLTSCSVMTWTSVCSELHHRH